MRLDYGRDRDGLHVAAISARWRVFLLRRSTAFLRAMPGLTSRYFVSVAWAPGPPPPVIAGFDNTLRLGAFTRHWQVLWGR